MIKYKINKDLAEETGIHVGDGSMNIYSGVYSYTLACHHIDDKEYMDNYIITLYEKIYGIQPKGRAWSKGTYGFRIHNKQIIEFKKDILGLPMGKKDKINIPSQILEKQSFRKDFLRGFIDTDGGINTFLANKRKVYPRIEMCNVSENLMKEINQILKDLGFRTSTWVTKSKKARWNDLSRLSINGFEMLKKWKDEIGFSNPKNIKKAEKLIRLE